jgi:peptide chain release factor subunit 1
MFTQEDLRELAAYEAESPILSVYLDVDPRERTTDEYKLALRELLREAEQWDVEEDIEAVERFFDHGYDWSGRGVVVFSGSEEDFWRAYSLAVPVTSGVTVARKPYIWPLAALVETYGRYVVALVGRQEMRLLHFVMGELTDKQHVEGEDVRKLKKGRGSSGGPGRRGGAPISGRHEEEMVQRNLRDAVKSLEQFWRQHDPQWLVLSGAEPTLTQFEEALPHRLQEQVIGTFSADMNASEVEIKDRSLEILRRAELEREAALVEAVFTAAAKGRGGAIRLADTLGAAHEGRIQTLVVARDYHPKGYQCQNCGYITDQALPKCPFCGGEVAEIPDAAEALVTQVIDSGGEVVVVDAEDHPRISEFGVGALLRY